MKKKMEKEIKSLSDKIDKIESMNINHIHVKYVKEFVKMLKEGRSCKNEECICCNENFAVLDKHAGPKLNGNNDTN